MSKGGQEAPGSRRDRRERILLGIMLFTGVAALVGGALLAIQPSGSLLQAKLSALSGTPFRDWRLPGILLATLVGGGGVGVFAWLSARGPRKRELIVLYALGLLGFEIVEWAWIGLQALEVVFGLLALAMLTLAVTSRTVRSERPMGGGSRFLQEIHLDVFGFPRVEIVADDRGGKRRTKGVQRLGGLPHRQTHERS